MSGLIRCAACLLFAVVAPTVVLAQHHLTTAEAKSHIGETATVCGEVVSTRYAASTKGHPTFLNLDKPYPKQEFTIVIWGEDRGKFGTPEDAYRDKRVCVTGKLVEYRGKPEVIANDPKQLMLEENRRRLC